VNYIFVFILFLPFFVSASPECDDITTSNQVYICSKLSLNESDIKLNDEYKSLLLAVKSKYKFHEVLGNEYIDKLRLSQRAWINFRDKNCDLLSYQMDIKSQAYETSINSCKDRMTQVRVKELILIKNQH